MTMTPIFDPCTYRIRLRGPVEANELNALVPIQVRIVRKSQAATLISAHTDQSGLVGLLRCLHGLGYVILSIARGPYAAGRP